MISLFIYLLVFIFTKRYFNWFKYKLVFNFTKRDAINMNNIFRKINANIRSKNWDGVKNNLIEYDIHPVEYYSNNGDSLLHMAIQYNAPIEIIKEILEYIDINSINSKGHNVIHIFVYTFLKFNKIYGTELLTLLLELGADINHIALDGYTPYLLFIFMFYYNKDIDYIYNIMKSYGANLSYVKKLYINEKVDYFYRNVYREQN